jgi:hypothetical protein
MKRIWHAGVIGLSSWPKAPVVCEARWTGNIPCTCMSAKYGSAKQSTISQYTETANNLPYGDWSTHT